MAINQNDIANTAIGVVLPLAVGLLLAVVGMVAAFCTVHDAATQQQESPAVVADFDADAEDAAADAAGTTSSDAADSSQPAESDGADGARAAITVPAGVRVDPEAVRGIASTVAAIAAEVDRVQAAPFSADSGGAAMQASDPGSATGNAASDAAAGSSDRPAESAPSDVSFTLPALTQDIMGQGIIPARAMILLYLDRGVDYPGSVYGQAGAPTIEDFVEILVEEAVAEGVKPEVLFAQVMHETAWLQFGNQVSVNQNNFGGLGATNDGSGGASFADVREGLRAQVQHLKAYASTQDLANDVVDPRFDLVERGVAPTVEDLGGTWAVPGDTYGEALMNIIQQLYDISYPGAAEGAYGSGDAADAVGGADEGEGGGGDDAEAGAEAADAGETAEAAEEGEAA